MFKYFSLALFFYFLRNCEPSCKTANSAKTRHLKREFDHKKKHFRRFSNYAHKDLY